MEKKTWKAIFCVLLAWPGVLTSPLVKEDSCKQFLDKVGSYLGADSLREDFNAGKPTLQMVLTKILPQQVFGMEQIDANDIIDVAAELFCPEIEFQFFLKEKMRSIERKIYKIWKAENVGDVLENIKEIGLELTETMERLAQSVEETEEVYIKELKSLYKVATELGPQVQDTIKKVGRIENEARKIRWDLKSLGETTVRRCQKILRALENLLNNTTPKEVDMKRMLRYTANLLEDSHEKLGESITRYEAMTSELDEIVVDLKTHDESLKKTANDAKMEYTKKTEKAKLNIGVSSIVTAFWFFGSLYGLADGEFGTGDIIGPAALVNNVHNLYSHAAGMEKLDEYYSSRSVELQTYRKDVQKHVQSSVDLKEILKLEEKAAGEWHYIVKEIQKDFGEDLKVLSEAIEDQKYLDDLIDAKASFGLLQKSAQNFLNLLTEKEERINEIHTLFKDDLGLTL